MIAHAEATGAITIGMENTGGEVRFQGVAGAPGVAIGQAVVISPLADLKAVPRNALRTSLKNQPF